MAITFPNSPSSGDTHTTSNGLQYTYDGEKWTTIGTNSAGTWTRSGTTVSLTTATDDLNVDSGTLFVDASTDRVGIGTSSPTANLEVSETGANASVLVNRTDAATAGTVSLNAGNTVNYINNSGTKDLTIQTNNTERMRINSSGNVGIGTQSPTTNLEINGGTNNNIVRIVSTDANANIEFADNTTTSGCQIGANGDNLKFGISGTEAMRLDSSGRLGLGTSSPEGVLSVYGTAAEPPTSGTTSNSLIELSSSLGNRLNFGLNTATGNYGAYIQASDNNLAVNYSLYLQPNGGNVGVGTTSPTQKFHIYDTNNAYLQLTTAGSTQSASGGFQLIHNGAGDLRANIVQRENAPMTFLTNDIERMRIDSAGNVGIGTSSPSALLDVNGQARFGGNKVTLDTNGSISGTISNSTTRAFMLSNTDVNADYFGGRVIQIGPDGTVNIGGSAGTNPASYTSPNIKLNPAGSSYLNGGNLGIGRTPFTSPAGYPLQLRGGSQALLQMSTSAHGDTATDGLSIGVDNSNAYIVQRENAPIAIYTSNTERMRITSSGNLLIGKTVEASATQGINLDGSNGFGGFARNGGAALLVNRGTNDGTLVNFLQNDNLEGSITVSGSTVSLVGGHLSRWSQLPGGVVRTEILRGSVLSNIDEMCEWGEEDNEQLNRMKVSDVEGDKNVSGVFQAWDDDDDTYTNDFYCAMTGDFVIRIAQGTTVARGDLLMSAGDGTAKPQDDDIVRSKTIAKVTSTTVSETYADNSYCVPCVLMAC